MIAEDLQIGHQVSTAEHRYVQFVIGDIRRRGYQGPIHVVGSRERGARISTKVFDNYCQELATDEYNKWQTRLNQIARENDIPAGKIRQVLQFISDEIPAEIQNIFKCRRPIDADLDLFVDAEMGKIPTAYEDLPCPEGSGLVVEIYARGDHGYLNQSPYNY